MLVLRMRFAILAIVGRSYRIAKEKHGWSLHGACHNSIGGFAWNRLVLATVLNQYGYTIRPQTASLGDSLLLCPRDCTEHLVLMSNGQDPTVVGLG